jgi:hypothetical protein
MSVNQILRNVLSDDRSVLTAILGIDMMAISYSSSCPLYLSHTTSDGERLHDMRKHGWARFRQRCFLLLIAMVVFAFSSCAMFAEEIVANPPHPPETFQVPFQLPRAGETFQVKSGDHLQTVLDKASLGDVVILQAGATFTGNFKLPNKTSGSGWIYIISSDLAALPEGKRVGPADAAHMPKIIAADDGNHYPALVTMFGAHHYRFAGIEIQVANPCYNVVCLGYGLANYSDALYKMFRATALVQLPCHITFDRCFIHSTSAANWTRTGVLANGRYVAVVDSYLSNFKDSSDAQAICSWFGTGPFKIVNNYLEASGENIMFGGARITITHTSDPDNYPAVDTGAIPADIEFRNNYCFKPLYWKHDDPSYAGHNWTLKNLFELKCAQRVLVTGNIFENTWEVNGQNSDGQRGTAIVLTPRNQYGDNPWAIVQDVTFTNNIIRHVGFGFRILAADDGQTSQQAQRILIHNNLWEDICSARYYNFMFFSLTGSVAAKPMKDLTVTHNTFLFPAGEGHMLSYYGDTDPPIKIALDPVINNNIFMHGDYGMSGRGTADGLASFNTWFNGYSVLKNVVIFRPSDREYKNSLKNFSKIYPPNNFHVSNIDEVGFTDYQKGNYRLKDSSKFRKAGTDGKDLGPDFDAINQATRGVLDGRENTRE